MITIDYLREKLLHATNALVVRPGPIKTRLLYAYTEYLSHLRAEHFPEDLGNTVASLSRNMTVEGTLAATVQAMTEENAIRLAEEILSLYDTIATRYYNRDVPVP